MPLVCTLLLTLAAIGLAFIIVLVGCAIEGFRTWRKWKRFVRFVDDLDDQITRLVAAHQDERRNAQNAMRQYVSSVDEFPVIPCHRDDCPRQPRRG